MEIENDFEYRGNNFRLVKWRITDLSDDGEGIVSEEKGTVQILKDNGEYLDIIEYNAFNLDKRYSEEFLSWIESGITEQYTKTDNFNFDKNHVIAFMEAHNRQLIETFDKTMEDVELSDVLNELHKDDAIKYMDNYLQKEVNKKLNVILKKKNLSQNIKSSDINHIANVRNKRSKDEWIKALHDGQSDGRLPKSPTPREITAFIVEHYSHYYDIQVDVYKIKNSKVLEIMSELNKKLDLDIELMDVEKNESKTNNMNMFKHQSATVISERDVNVFLSELNNENVSMIKLDFSKELDEAYIVKETIAKEFKEMVEKMTKFIGAIKKSCQLNEFVIVLDNLDYFVKEMQKQSMFLDDKKQSLEQIIRDVFLIELTKWQSIGKVVILSEEKIIEQFIGGDRALSRRLAHN